MQDLDLGGVLDVLHHSAQAEQVGLCPVVCVHHFLYQMCERRFLILLYFSSYAVLNYCLARAKIKKPTQPIIVFFLDLLPATVTSSRLKYSRKTQTQTQTTRTCAELWTRLLPIIVLLCLLPSQTLNQSRNASTHTNTFI